MSVRQLLKTYHSGSFYFPSDKTLMIIPTKLIQEEMYQAGMVVTLSLNKKLEKAEIIELSGKWYL